MLAYSIVLSPCIFWSLPVNAEFFKGHMKVTSLHYLLIYAAMSMGTSIIKDSKTIIFSRLEI